MAGGGGGGEGGGGGCGDACTPPRCSNPVCMCICASIVHSCLPSTPTPTRKFWITHSRILISSVFTSHTYIPHTHIMAKHAANKGKAPLTDKNNKRKRDAQDNKHEDAPVALFAAVKDTELDDIFAKSVSVHRPWPFLFLFFFLVKRSMLIYRHSRTPFLHLCLLPAHQKLISRRHLSPLPKRAKRALHPKCKWKRMWK